MSEPSEHERGLSNGEFAYHLETDHGVFLHEVKGRAYMGHLHDEAHKIRAEREAQNADSGTEAQ